MQNLLTGLFLIISISLSGQDISLMTYNIRLDVASDGENAWPKRKDFLVGQLKFYAPDIFGIQEGMPHQTCTIGNELESYKFIGHGRDGGAKGEYSAIFYNTDKFTVEQVNTFWLSPTPDTFSQGWDAAYPRICTYGLFTHKSSGEKIWVFNTHLDHVGVEARKNGIQLILRRIKILNQAQHPVVLMGDFNVDPNSKLIASLSKQMNDSKSISMSIPFGPNGTFNGFNFDKPVSRRIDYIFLSKTSNLKINKYAVLSDSKNLKYPSDHLPVLVIFEIK